jgi:type VI secretion system protein ImpC
VKVKVFNCSLRDLSRDLDRAAEFDQSGTWRRVYEEEFGVFGGEPFGLLVGDYAFSNTPQHLACLSHMSGVAAGAHAPFIAAAAPDLFGLSSFVDIDKPRHIEKIFWSVEYAKWRSFRESEDSRYVGLCLPRMLLRAPYRGSKANGTRFEYDEHVTTHDDFLWGNAAFAFAGRVVDAFARHGWCTAIRGVEGGGLVDGLPTHTFGTDHGEQVLKCPTEVPISDRRETELAAEGFIPLVHCKGRDFAAFFSAASTNRPRKFDTHEAYANARLSAELPYLLAVSRFAHYLKAIMRDKVGSFMSRRSTEEFLQQWLSQYVLLDDDASLEAKARYPVRDAQIELEEVPGRPGTYRGIMHLKPHFQVSELDVSLRVVADLPPSRR